MNKRNSIWILLIILIGLLVLVTACRQTPPGEPEATSSPSPIAKAPGPDWAKFEGGGVELWLPDTYVGGDPDVELETILEELFAADFDRMARALEQNPSIYSIWAFDANVGDAPFLTSVNVNEVPVSSATTVEAYMEGLAGQFPPHFKVVEGGTLSFQGYDAARWIIEVGLPDPRSKELLYVLKDDDRMWNLTFVTDIEEFDERLPEFEESARTFTVSALD